MFLIPRRVFGLGEGPRSGPARDAGGEDGKPPELPKVLGGSHESGLRVERVAGAVGNGRSNPPRKGFGPDEEGSSARATGTTGTDLRIRTGQGPTRDRKLLGATGCEPPEGLRSRRAARGSAQRVSGSLQAHWVAHRATPGAVARLHRASAKTAADRRRRRDPDEASAGSGSPTGRTGPRPRKDGHPAARLRLSVRTEVDPRVDFIETPRGWRPRPKLPRGFTYPLLPASRPPTTRPSSTATPSRCRRSRRVGEGPRNKTVRRENQPAFRVDHALEPGIWLWCRWGGKPSQRSGGPKGKPAGPQGSDVRTGAALRGEVGLRKGSPGTAPSGEGHGPEGLPGPRLRSGATGKSARPQGRSDGGKTPRGHELRQALSRGFPFPPHGRLA